MRVELQGETVVRAGREKIELITFFQFFNKIYTRGYSKSIRAYLFLPPERSSGKRVADRAMGEARVIEIFYAIDIVANS